MKSTPCIERAAYSTIHQLENRLFLSAADVWVINGDYSRRQPSDSIVIDINPDDKSQLRARVNGQTVGTRKISDLSIIQVAAGRGDDRVSLEVGAAGANLEFQVFAGDGNDSILGDAGDQFIDGGAGNDWLDAAGGDDTIYGGLGNDDIAGDDGNDAMAGGAGNDSISGGWGMDRVSGDRGADFLDGGEGRDMVAGGNDNDILKGGSGRDAYDGQSGKDWIYLQPGYDSEAIDPADRHRAESGRLPMFRAGREMLKQKIREMSLQNWESYFGKPLPQYWYTNSTLAAALNAGAPVLANSGGNNGGGTPTRDYSETNVQVEGVDEADVVETDGDYLYTMLDRELVITDTARRQIVYRQTLPENASGLGLYLMGTRLTVLSWNYESGSAVVGDTTDENGAVIPTRWREYTRVTTYDVSDRTAPTVLEQVDLDGDYVNSRAIGDRVYVVVSNRIEGVVPLLYADGEGGYRYETREQYLARLDRAIDDAMPGYAATDAAGKQSWGVLLGDDNYWSEVQDDNWWYEPTMSVTMLDTGDGIASPVTSANVAGWGGELYVSGQSMYIAEYGWYNYDNEEGYRSNLYKFNLGTDQIVLAATGRVLGSIINQFAMDENGQYFRVATQRWGDVGNFSSLFVLDQVGSELQVVGSIPKIAPGEMLYAARFMGERGYLITFQRTDPLFTLDLTDPTAPRIVGELIIPGFSRYLQPIDSTHIIGLGQSADENGRTTGTQVSLFDVSDMANPQRVGVYTLPNSDRWSSSVAEWDHHAFSYFPQYQILAFPVEYFRSDNGDYTVALQVVQIDPDTGINGLGIVTHTDFVLRSVRIGTELFSIGYDAIRVANLLNPEELLGVIELGARTPSYMNWNWWTWWR